MEVLLLYIEKMFKTKTKTVFKGTIALIIHLSLMKTCLCRQQAPRLHMGASRLLGRLAQGRVDRELG